MARRKNQPRYSLLQKPLQKLLQKRIRTGPTPDVTEGNSEKLPEFMKIHRSGYGLTASLTQDICKGAARSARLSFQKTLAIAQFIFYNIEFIFRGVVFGSMTRKKQLSRKGIFAF